MALHLRKVFFLIFEKNALETLQTHHVDSTLKRRGNGRFHVISTWNPREVFVGKDLTFRYIIISEKIKILPNGFILFKSSLKKQVSVNTYFHVFP